MSNYKLLVQRIGLNGFTNLLVSLTSIILLPVITKTMSINDYGIWVQISVTIGLITSVMTLGLPDAMVRFFPIIREKDDIKEEFFSIFFTTLIISGVVSFLLLLTFKYFQLSSVGFGFIHLFEIGLLVIVLEPANNILFNYFRTFQQIKRHSLSTILYTFLKVILITYFALTTREVLGAMIGLLIADSITFIFLLLFVISKIGFKIPKFANVKSYLAFSIPTVPSNLSSWIVSSSDRYVIGILLGTMYVGYYSPGYSLGNIINMFISPFSFILPAVLSKYYDENNLNEITKILNLSFKYFLMVVIPATFGISILSKPLLSILSTPEIAAKGYLITPFSALSALFFGLYAIVLQILILEKRLKITSRIWILSSILNLGLNIILVPYLGILGAALTTLVAYFFSFLLTTYYAFKFIKLSIDFIFILKCVIASTIMCLAISKFGHIWLSNLGLSHLLVTIGGGVIVYIIVLMVLKVFKEADVAFFKQIIKFHD